MKLNIIYRKLITAGVSGCIYRKLITAAVSGCFGATQRVLSEYQSDAAL